MIAARVLTRQTPVRLDTRGYDFLIAQGSRPLTVSPGTQKIVRYHDMIPVLQPDTRPHSRDIGWHHTAIKESIGKSFYVCNSDPTREDLIDTYPELTDQSETIPYVLSERYWPDPQPQAIEAVIGMRRSNATGVRPARSIKRLPRFLMCVSTLEPRKNFIGLIQAFNTLKMRPAVRKAVPNLKLLLVGSPGWRYEPTLNAMRELVRRGDLIHLEQLTADELRLLYTHAEAFVFPSHAEGFGFPPVEAMRCGTPVIASDIPAHRWVLGDAALYCNSYDVRSIADAVERLVASPESTTIRAQLIQRGRQQTQQFTLDRCMGQWHDLLMRLKHKSPPVKTAGFDKPRLMQEAA
jgi:glycosyltransferase involved in cell wall biosynthesis